MQYAAEENPGTMAACLRAESDAWVANYNAPGQVVIAGSKEAVAEAGALAKELGAKKVIPIPVGGAFHTPLMAPARDRLRKALATITFHAPEPEVISNVDARPRSSAADWPRLLSAQLCHPDPGLPGATVRPLGHWPAGDHHPPATHEGPGADGGQCPANGERSLNTTGGCR